VKKLGIALMAAGLLVFAITSATFATQPPDHKVGLCHRTASDSNPYVYIEVDVASLPAHLNNLPGHPAKTNADGSPRNDYLADSASDCDQQSEPTPTPTPEPTATPTPSETPVPSVTPSDTPRPDRSTPPRTLPQTDTVSDVANVVSPGWQWTLVMAFVVGLAWGALKVKDRFTR